MKCVLKDSQYVLDIDNNLRESGCAIGRIAEINNIVCYQGNEILYDVTVPLFNDIIFGKKVNSINILVPKTYIDVVYKELGEETANV